MKSMILVMMVALTGCSAIMPAGPGSVLPRRHEVFTVRYRVDCEVCSIRFSGLNGQSVTVENNVGSWFRSLSLPREGGRPSQRLSRRRKTVVFGVDRF